MDNMRMPKIAKEGHPTSKRPPGRPPNTMVRELELDFPHTVVIVEDKQDVIL